MNWIKAILVVAVLAVRPVLAQMDSTHANEHFSGTITLERTQCYGSCPAYALTIDHAGRATLSYKGRGGPWRRTALRYVGDSVMSGETHKFTIDSVKVQRLVQQLRRDGFFGFDFDYTPRNKKNCGSAATDNPSASLEVTDDTVSHHIDHYYGCQNAPEILATMESRVDSLIGIDLR